jgi:Protein of unknwon function (DUF3310)
MLPITKDEVSLKDIIKNNEALFPSKPPDPVTRPPYYIGKGMEVLDFIDAFDLDLYEGSIVQYVVRHKKKGGLQDLLKAKFYLDRLIEKNNKNADG